MKREKSTLRRQNKLIACAPLIHLAASVVQKCDSCCAHSGLSPEAGRAKIPAPSCDLSLPPPEPEKWSPLFPKSFLHYLGGPEGMNCTLFSAGNG